MNQFCPRCGGFFAPDVNMEFSTTQVLCVECGLALEDPPQILPPSDVDDEQVAYDLAEWPPEDRTIATADLVELEGLNPTMLSRVVGKLTELELIHRIPDPADARAARVEVTPTGKEVHHRIKARRAQVVSDCLDRLPERTTQTLLEALPALEALAEELRTTEAAAKN